MQIKFNFSPAPKIALRNTRCDYMRAIMFLIVCTSLFACKHDTSEAKSPETIVQSDTIIVEDQQDTTEPTPLRFDRDLVLDRIDQKVKDGESRFIHVFVPLCDNEHQGIVPVNSRLGDGLNLTTNLYWGAGYGVKTHFKRSPKWRMISSDTYDNGAVMERVLFEHVDSAVYLLADAYRGDSMRQCLVDYFNTISGVHRYDTIDTGEGVIVAFEPDLIVFNGHNGLMDVRVEAPRNVDGKAKDAVAIACVSGVYFNSELSKAGGYPLVMTQHLLAPEAYVIDAIFDSWIKYKSPEEIRMSAARGYHGVQKCGLRGASNLFSTGWGEED